MRRALFTLLSVAGLALCFSWWLAALLEHGVTAVCEAHDAAFRALMDVRDRL